MILRSFLRPVSSGWWFVTAYILLALFVPVINPFINSLSKNGFILFLAFVWAFYYSVGIVLGDSYLPLIRAFFFYSLGAFICLYLPRENLSFKKILILIFACLLIWAVMGFSNFFSRPLLSKNLSQIPLKTALLNRFSTIASTCFGTPIFALCFFRLFENLNLKFSPFVNKIASATFGVYLIHDSSFLRPVIWNGIFKVSEVQFISEFFPLLAFFDIALVFAACALIDFFRQKFFEARYLRFFEKFELFLKAKFAKEKIL